MSRTEAILAGLAALFVVAAGAFGDAGLTHVSVSLAVCALGSLVLLMREIGWMEA